MRHVDVVWVFYTRMEERWQVLEGVHMQTRSGNH